MQTLFYFILLCGSLCSGGLAAQRITPVKVTELTEQWNREDGLVVINFWSTWCKPCVEEIPEFIQVYDSLKKTGIQLWLVSQDTRSLFESGKLKKYIAGKPGWDKARLFWFDETDADYYCPRVDESWSGVIPATLIVHKAKGYRRFIEEQMSAERLLQEIEKARGE